MYRSVFQNKYILGVDNVFDRAGFEKLLSLMARAFRTRNLPDPISG